MNRILLAGFVALQVAANAQAQTYPSRAISMIVPFPPGGQTDAIGRILGEHMRISLGQPIVVENVAGAGGSIALGRAARAAPDGYTLSIGNWGAYVANGVMYKLQYDLLTDFEPVAFIAESPLMIVSNKGVPADNMRDLLAWLNEHPEKASQGSSGVGSPGHIAGAFFQAQTGTRLQHVPYRGTAPALQDLVAGRISVMFDSPTALLPQVRAGNIKVYAVTAGSRSAVAADIPTVDEVGLPGFHFSTWNALFVPKGTPAAIVNRLNAAVVDALADPDVRSKLLSLGQNLPFPDQQTPEALKTFHKGEIEKWWPIIKAAGIKTE